MSCDWSSQIQGVCGGLLQLWKKGSFVEEKLPLDTLCIDGSDYWVILTVLMGKEVEDV